ncbi:homoserine O-acetyltransferase [Obelidium mucronatum]|nr:homoserine O-acetyltransferase [Obelidium mucronatum]
MTPPPPIPAASPKQEPYQLYSHEKPFKLHLGGVLPRFEIAYESWGQLNERKDNVILLTTGLSASSHAKSHFGNRKDGWWEKFIGPGLPLDTNKFHIICTNVIGGCYGSTGPSSIDPIASEKEGRQVRYAVNFPMVTLWDMVRAQFRMLDYMGVDRVHAVVGSSMGGMLSLAAASLFPDRVGRIISISGCARTHPYSIALRHAQRQVLMSDPDWMGGKYYDHGVIPAKGLSSGNCALVAKERIQNQSQVLKTDFQIESYLQASGKIESKQWVDFVDRIKKQGNKWVGQYDANSLIYISRAMDMFDMTERPLTDPNDIQTAPQPEVKKLSAREEAQLMEEKTVTDYMHTAHLSKGMSTIQCPSLVIGVKSDFLIPSWQQKEIATCLKAAGNTMVTHFEIDGVFGHDTFLLDFTNVGSAVKGHLEIELAHSVPGEWSI